MSRDIDWSKAGKRLRWTPRTEADGGRNPDWNWQKERWKDEADYVGQDLTPGEVVAMVACPVEGCGGFVAGRFCHDARGAKMDYPHAERRRLAAERRIAGEA